MPDPRTIQVALRLEVEGDDVRGTAHADDAPAHEFIGWLGLIAALDAIVEAPARPRPADD